MRGASYRIDPVPTIADGLRVREAGRLSRVICGRRLDGMVTVTEAEVRRAMAHLALEERQVVEGAGAVAVAALAQVPGRRRMAIVTGGNVDRGVLRDVLGDVDAAA